MVSSHLKGNISYPALLILIITTGVILSWLHYEHTLRKLLHAQKELDACAAQRGKIACVHLNHIEVLQQEMRVLRTLLKSLPPLSPKAALLRVQLQGVALQRQLVLRSYQASPSMCRAFWTPPNPPFIQTPPDILGPSLWKRVPHGTVLHFWGRFSKRTLYTSVGLFYGTQKSTHWAPQWVRTGAR